MDYRVSLTPDSLESAVKQAGLASSILGWLTTAKQSFECGPDEQFDGTCIDRQRTVRTLKTIVNQIDSGKHDVTEVATIPGVNQTTFYFTVRTDD